MLLPPRHVSAAARARLPKSIRFASAALLVAATAKGAAPGRAASLSRPAYEFQAATAMARLESDFFDPRRGYFTVTHIAFGPVASVWPTSQALAAAVDVARMTRAPADLARVRRIIASLHGYLAPGGVYHTRTMPSRRYTDDNNWIALDLLDAYDLTHDASLLAPVKRIFAFVVSMWDAKRGGGILWADGRLDRCTVSQGPAITIGLRLAAITGQSYYRSWAARIYNWENAHLRRPDGIYWDHIQPDGKVDRDIVSYNQGVMIDANVAYFRLTGQRRYLDEATRIAREAARVLPTPWRSRGMFANFDGIYAWSLVHLNAAKPGAANLTPVSDYIAWAWPLAQTRRSPSLRTEAGLLEQAGYVMEATAVAAP